MLTYVSTRRDNPDPEKESIMKASDLTVGTVYLVSDRNDWREHGYWNKAYRLVSLYKMSTKINYGYHAKVREVTVNDTVYTCSGRPWAYKSTDGEAKYLMIEVDAKTHEPIEKIIGGRQFLALIAPREIRGEWKTASEEAAALRQADGERKRERAEKSRVSRERMTRVANRFRALLGIEADTYTSALSNSTTHYNGTTWGQGVTLSTDSAEQILNRLEAAEARVAELAELEQEARHRVAELESILSDNNL